MRKIFLTLVIYFVFAALQWFANYLAAPSGYSINIFVVAALAVASISGPVAAMTFAFLSGLYVDFMGLHLFGVFALMHTVFAFFVFMVRSDVNFTLPLVQIIFSALSAFLCLIVYGLAGMLLLGKFTFGAWGDFLFAPVLAALLSLIIFPLVRRLLADKMSDYAIFRN